MVLKYPSHIVVATSNRVLSYSQTARQTQDDKIIFDLSKTHFLTPFGIVLLAGTISECLSQNKKVQYGPPENEETKNFLSGIGFHEFFHLPLKKQKIENSHVQLRRLTSIDYLLTQQIVEVFDNAITMSEGLQGSLTMAINEIMTNAFDHSESEKGCYVCAQAYTNLIRLCVADFGVGLYAKLSPKYSDQIQDSYGAIKLAIKDGVTTREFGGLGLGWIKRLIKVNGGQMSILSGDGKAVWDFRGSRTRLKKQTMSLPFTGTIINLEINKDKETLYFLIDQEGQIF